MSTNNVDLSAVLPVLTDAVTPFVYAMELLDKLPAGAKISEESRVRMYAPLGDMRIVEIRRLLQAIEAVYRMANVELKPTPPGTKP